MPEREPVVFSDPPIGRDPIALLSGLHLPPRPERGAVPGALPPFDYQPLGRVISERGALARLGEAVRWVSGSRVLLVTDPGLEHAGDARGAWGSVLEAGLSVFSVDGVREIPTVREVHEGAAVAGRLGFD